MTIKSLFFSASLSVSILLLTGCPNSNEERPDDAAPDREEVPVEPGTTSLEGLVIPLEPAPPKSSEPAEKPNEVKPAPVTPKAEEKVVGASLVPAEAFGKIAAEAFPMAPIADLVAQVDEYMDKIGKNLEDLDPSVAYRDDAGRILRDANGLALIALSIGMAPTDSPYKKKAPALLKAATELARAGSSDEAKKSYEQIRLALEGEGGAETLQWTKVAQLAPVMKAVPNLSSTVVRLTGTERNLKRNLQRTPKRVFGPTAGLAAIFQGSVANAADTIKPDAVDEWTRECEMFRDVAIKANAAAHGYADGKIDYAEYWSACKEMVDSCDRCHKVFYPDAVGKSE